MSLSPSKETPSKSPHSPAVDIMKIWEFSEVMWENEHASCAQPEGGTWAMKLWDVLPWVPLDLEQLGPPTP